jgi:hypothetical protein
MVEGAPGRLLDASATCAKINSQIGGGSFSMPIYVTREEFEARVGVLEREVEGEKLVTRHILEQSRRNGDDLAAVKTRLDRVEQKLDGLDLRFSAFLRDYPTAVGEIMRQVQRERDERS